VAFTNGSSKSGQDVGRRKVHGLSELNFRVYRELRHSGQKVRYIRGDKQGEAQHETQGNMNLRMGKQSGINQEATRTWALLAAVAADGKQTIALHSPLGQRTSKRRHPIDLCAQVSLHLKIHLYE